MNTYRELVLKLNRGRDPEDIYDQGWRDCGLDTADIAADADAEIAALRKSLDTAYVEGKIEGRREGDAERREAEADRDRWRTANAEVEAELAARGQRVVELADELDATRTALAASRGTSVDYACEKNALLARLDDAQNELARTSAALPIPTQLEQVAQMIGAGPKAHGLARDILGELTDSIRALNPAPVAEDGLTPEAREDWQAAARETPAWADQIGITTEPHHLRSFAERGTR